MRPPCLVLKSYLIALSVFLLVTTNALGGDDYVPEPKEVLISTIIEQLRTDEYDSAFVNISKLRQTQPESAICDVLVADAYQSMMRDYRVRLYEAQFDSVIKLALKKIKKSLKQEPSAENYFTFAIAKGYLAVHKFYQGKWLGAINSAMSSMQSIKVALSIDPEFVDPLFGIAIYEYGKSKALGFGLDMFKSNRREAIELLEKVKDQGKYVPSNAAYAQMMIYLDEKKYQRALDVSDQLYAKYANNPSCLYSRALILEQLGRGDETVEIWQKLIGRIEAFPKQSNGFLAECHYRLGKLYWQQGRKADALAQIKLAQEFAKKYKSKEELETVLVKFKDVKKAIKKDAKAWRKEM